MNVAPWQRGERSRYMDYYDKIVAHSLPATGRTCCTVLKVKRGIQYRYGEFHIYAELSHIFLESAKFYKTL